MKINDEIIMISETDSEYIDKIILIINKDKKRAAPKELLIKQAEKIIYEYENRLPDRKKNNLFKLFFSVLACITASLIACFLGIHLFY
ncbi:MAG: hypothetical protein E7411_04670 [Ruminococcaceae bacterium]|nr:hypothetical protein [Oscillospiraceae bacterium]